MVDLPYQENGVGRKLNIYTLNHARQQGVSVMSVTTWSTNLRCFHALQKQGFRIYKVVGNERASGVHGIYLQRSLVNPAENLSQPN